VHLGRDLRVLGEISPAKSLVGVTDGRKRGDGHGAGWGQSL
jgi:hypothetical protein